MSTSVLIFFLFFFNIPEDKKLLPSHLRHSRHSSAVEGESVCVYCGIHYEKVIDDLYVFSQINKAILNCLCV